MLAEIGCKPGEIETDDKGYKVDDAECEDGENDIKLDKDLRITSRRRGIAPRGVGRRRSRVHRPRNRRFQMRTTRPVSAACAAASRATGTRNGEQET